MTSFHPICYHRDFTQLACPLPMSPLRLYFHAKFCDVLQKGLLLHFQREAHRVGYVSDVPEDKPLLGTPSHCLVGLPPPWRRFPNRTHMIPAVIELIVARQIERTRGLAARFLEEQFLLAAEDLRIPMNRRGTVFDQQKSFVHDVFVVYATLVKGKPVDVEGRDLQRLMAEIEVHARICNQPTAEAMRIEAHWIAADVCEAIDIEFS